jgi:radical SAM superfamily enzyme YgiQ (UPF0313 family)
MNSPDIVLVKPGSQKILYGELSAANISAIEPPLWAALLAAFLREKGFSVELIDAEIENWSPAHTAEIIKDMKPKLAGIIVSGTNPSASTMNMIGASAIVNCLKQISPNLPTLIGGLHPSALPQRTMSEEKVDFVCAGEGFHTIPKLLEALKAGEKAFPIEGLWYRKDGKICSNPPAAILKDLDRLPMPAWDLLPMKRYRAHNWHCFDHIEQREPYAVIYSSLGCPFHCSFCCINAIFGKPGIRYRSPGRVIEEIDCLVKNYGIKNIKILDEMFVLKEPHVNELCDLLIQRGYGLNFWAYARVDTVNEKLLQKMKRAGINWVAYGFESGSKNVLDGVRKGYKPDQVGKAVKMTYDAGLYIIGNFIFGLPDDNNSTMKETLDLSKDLNCEFVNYYCTMAYPGSKLYQQALEKDWKLPSTWEGYSQFGYESFPLATKYLSGSEVLAFRDQAFIEYFSNPTYLAMIRGKFGEKIVQVIQEMLSVKVDRRYVNKQKS